MDRNALAISANFRWCIGFSVSSTYRFGDLHGCESSWLEIPGWCFARPDPGDTTVGGNPSWDTLLGLGMFGENYTEDHWCHRWSGKAIKCDRTNVLYKCHVRISLSGILYHDGMDYDIGQDAECFCNRLEIQETVNCAKRFFLPWHEKSNVCSVFVCSCDSLSIFLSTREEIHINTR